MENKSCNYITAISKNECIDELDDVVDKFNYTNYRTIKMKPISIKWSKYTGFYFKDNDKDSKLVIMCEYKNTKSPSSSEEFFVIKKVKNTVPWTYAINDLSGEKNIGSFCEKRVAKDKANRV